jgi:hypothetical protein
MVRYEKTASYSYPAMYGGRKQIASLTKRELQLQNVAVVLRGEMVNPDITIELMKNKKTGRPLVQPSGHIMSARESLVLPGVAATAASAAATASITTAITTSTTAASATATTAFGARASFVDGQRAAFKLKTIELSNCLLCLGIIRHFDKAESARFAAEFVSHDCDA